VDVGVAKYDPCNPASVIGLLEEWSGWTNFKLPDDKYFNRKAEGILGPDSLKNLEFTRELWDGLATHNKIMKGWTYRDNELKAPDEENHQ
jgi:hypothetical protein